MAGSTLSDNEIAQLRDIVDLCTPAEPGPERLLDLLGCVEQLVSCEAVSLQRLDSVAHAAAFFGATEQGVRYPATAQEREQMDGSESGDFWQHYWQSPCCLPDRAGRPVVTSAGAVYTEAQWRRHPMRTEFLGPNGIVDDLLVTWPEGPGRTLRLIATRGDGPIFGERERFLMTLLQPHLRDMVVACSRPSEEVPAPSLTGRQREILRLVQLGWSNKQIARALAISTGTVRKHLEHIYERLNVQSRTAAVGTAFVVEPEHSVR